jgi:hypothetical protein
MPDIAESVQKLLRRLEEKTEEIQTTRLRLFRLEFERAQIREHIKGYFVAENKTHELEAQESDHVSLFGRKVEGSISLNTGAPVSSSITDQQGGATALREAAEAVDRLGGEVDARRLANALRISFDAARLRLARACKDGLLKRSSYGKYVSARNAEDNDIAF